MQKTVVVVQRLSDFADQFADWLSLAGYRVLLCTGPTPPCASDLGDSFECPLWGHADLLIYDPWLQLEPNAYGSGALLKLERTHHPTMPVLIWGSGVAIPGDIADMEKPGEVEILPLELSSADLVTAVEHLIGPADGRSIHWAPASGLGS